MSLYSVNFSVTTNEDWLDTLVFVENAGEEDETPVDLAGSVFEMQLRRQIEELKVVFALTTGNGRLIIEGGEGDTGKLTISVAQPTVDDIDPGVYVYDMVWTTPEARKVNVMKGTVTVELGVKRP